MHGAGASICRSAGGSRRMKCARGSQIIRLRNRSRIRCPVVLSASCRCNETPERRSLSGLHGQRPWCQSLNEPPRPHGPRSALFGVFAVRISGQDFALAEPPVWHASRGAGLRRRSGRERPGLLWPVSECLQPRSWRRCPSSGRDSDTTPCSRNRRLRRPR